jgi:hypothetical protein
MVINKPHLAHASPVALHRFVVRPLHANGTSNSRAWLARKVYGGMPLAAFPFLVTVQFIDFLCFF